MAYRILKLLLMNNIFIVIEQTGLNFLKIQSFNFLSAKDAGVNAEKAQKLSETDLKKMPQIANKLKKGAIQVQDYSKKLEKKYGNLKLQKFVVVALGFERVCFDKIEGG